MNLRKNGRTYDRYDLMDLPFVIVAFVVMGLWQMPIWAELLVMALFVVAGAVDDLADDIRNHKRAVRDL